MVNVYKVMLSGQGDWLIWVNEGDEDYWFAEQNIDMATSFTTYSKAVEFIVDYDIRRFWPQANIQVVAVKGEYRG